MSKRSIIEAVFVSLVLIGATIFMHQYHHSKCTDVQEVVNAVQGYAKKVDARFKGIEGKVKYLTRVIDPTPEPIEPVKELIKEVTEASMAETKAVPNAKD